jgi:hypothetical protein
MTLARLLVGTYLALVVASLFYVPWDGWVYDAPFAAFPDRQVWHRAVRHGTIFAPPSGLHGERPTGGNYFTARRPEPQLNRLMALWVAGGIVTLGAAWAISSRPPRPESAASPSPAPRARLS